MPDSRAQRLLAPRTWRPLFYWPVALAACVAAACLLAAPLHGFLMDRGWMARPEAAAELDRYFLKVFRRLLLVFLAAVFLWRVRPWREPGSGYGLRPVRAGLRTSLRYLAATVLVLIALLAWQLAMGWLRFEDPLRWGEFAKRVLNYLVGGYAAGFLEEWFFRGWLTDRFEERHRRTGLAIVLSSLVYAGAHAFKPHASMVGVSHDAGGALQALLAWCAHVFSAAFLAAAAGLFCFALLLTAVYRRSGRLWASIGVHAGAVLVLFSYGALTDRGATPAWAGTRLLYDGLPVAGLLLLGAWLLRPRRAGSETSQAPTG